MKNIALIFLTAIIISGHSQTPSTISDVTEGIKSQNQLMESSIVRNLKFQNIGPSVMSGRVTDIEVNPSDPTEFYVAYASGGLWHTTNNGNTFVPIFDSSNTQNIGDFAVDWNRGIIVVGTGENNSSRSSYAGIGILKSINNGESWENIGLKDSHHIGKVKINPENPNEIIVGVIGHLYSENKQRGIFKTKDGGKSWNNTLFIDAKTGIIDLEIDPDNFNIQFASSWARSRTSWNFNGNGEKSGIYKSIDAGESWTLMSNKKSGFPNNNGVGRIGVSIYDSQTIYAIVDNQNRRPKLNETKKEGLDKDSFEKINENDFLMLENKDLDKFLSANNFPNKYNAEIIKQMVKSNQIAPIDLKLFLEDANTVMFDTPIIGAEVYRSDDGGVNWKKQNSYFLDNLYNTYGYYFGRIHVSPKNKDQIYIYGVPILKSDDGGATYKSIDYQNLHVDHHDLWINPKNPQHLINGNDGGVNISYDGGENWIKLNQPSVGQFYAINVDNSKPYNVYGGLQDNGVWMAKNNSKESLSWHQNGHNNWKSIMGGDGMQIQIDNRNPELIYTGSQFGFYYRLNNNLGTRKLIKPKHDLGEKKLRFNWQTPILLSPHNQDILYLGSNKLHVSLNKGDDWVFKSKDLTKGIKKGNVPYGTLTAIDESVFKFGKIVIGSDDGLVQLTNDGGNNWKLVSENLPKNLWVSRVLLSKHKENRIYVSLNGYRFDDFKSYVFVSDDNGTNWVEISKNLPASPVNVIREDPKYEDLLYVGTDNGVYISLNKGIDWAPFVNGLNKVAVHDLVVQKRENDLILGTHGRSIYKMNLDPIYNYIDNIDKSSDGIVFEAKNIQQCRRCGTKRYNWDKNYYEEKLKIIVFSKSKQSSRLEIFQEDVRIYNGEIDLIKGFQNVELNMDYSKKALKSLKKIMKDEIKISDDQKYYFSKGNYTLKIGNYSESFQIK